MLIQYVIHWKQQKHNFNAILTYNLAYNRFNMLHPFLIVGLWIILAPRKNPDCTAANFEFCALLNSHSWWGPWAEMDGQILLTFDRVRRIANMMWDFTFRYLLWNIPNNWGLTATVICKPFSDFLVAFKVWLASGWEHLFQQIWYVPWKHRRVCGQPRWQHWWNFVPKLHLELIWSYVWCWNWPPACRIFWCISSFFFSWKFSRFLLCVFGICEIFFASVLFLCWLPKVRLPASCESACCFTSKTAKQKSINSYFLLAQFMLVIQSAKRWHFIDVSSHLHHFGYVIFAYSELIFDSEEAWFTPSRLHWICLHSDFGCFDFRGVDHALVEPIPSNCWTTRAWHICVSPVHQAGFKSWRDVICA